MTESLHTATNLIIETGRRFDARGWAMAGSGNYSCRLDDGTVAITVSGRHKGKLSADDVMRVDASGRSLDQRRASAETPLHMLIYRLRPEVQSVLHTHSIAAVTLGRLVGEQPVFLRGYEMLKSLAGYEDHDDVAVIPTFENDQDMPALASRVETAVSGTPRTPGLLLRGHGLYAWGASVERALCAIEGLEHMIACELERARIDQGGITWRS